MRRHYPKFSALEWVVIALVTATLINVLSCGDSTAPPANQARFTELLLNACPPDARSVEDCVLPADFSSASADTYYVHRISFKNAPVFYAELHWPPAEGVECYNPSPNDCYVSLIREGYGAEGTINLGLVFWPGLIHGLVYQLRSGSGELLADTAFTVNVR
jgi:hypothetical protein